MAELTQRFNGRSLEEAIGKATGAFGSGAEILEAKRVRRGGVFGMLQSESYEVIAQPRLTSASAAAPRRNTSFDHELRSMIDEVDLREERQVLTQAPPRAAQSAAPRRKAQSASAGAARPRVANRFTDDDLRPLPPEPARTATARVASAARPAAPVRTAAARVESTGERHLAKSLTPQLARTAVDALLPPPPAPKRSRGDATIDLRESQAAGPAWSSHNLRVLGVPEAVLELMPTASLDSDVAWTVALEAAIRARLPLTPTVPLAVHGYGDNAAVKMLESTMNGYAMGDLHLLDRVVPATAFELTLAIRACLSR